MIKSQIKIKDILFYIINIPFFVVAVILYPILVKIEEEKIIIVIVNSMIGFLFWWGLGIGGLIFGVVCTLSQFLSCKFGN